MLKLKTFKLWVKVEETTDKSKIRHGENTVLRPPKSKDLETSLCLSVLPECGVPC